MNKKKLNTPKYLSKTEIGTQENPPSKCLQDEEMLQGGLMLSDSLTAQGRRAAKICRYRRAAATMHTAVVRALRAQRANRTFWKGEKKENFKLQWRKERRISTGQNHSNIVTLTNSSRLK